MNHKVAILGKLDTKYQAPFHDDSWDIWSFNTHKDRNEIPRVDIWFDIHTYKPDTLADMRREDIGIKYLEEMVGGKYFNNSVSYLIAFAIFRGYKEIALYGMKFESAKEGRKAEYQNVRELIFFAKGRGIKITAPADPEMLQEYEPYGV